MSENLASKTIASQETLNFGQQVVELSIKVRAHAEEKLVSVILPQNPKDGNIKEMVRKSLPPLFNELHNKFEAIEANLILISTLLTAAEL